MLLTGYFLEKVCDIRKIRSHRHNERDASTL